MKLFVLIAITWNVFMVESVLHTVWEVKIRKIGLVWRDVEWQVHSTRLISLLLRLDLRILIFHIFGSSELQDVCDELFFFYDHQIFLLVLLVHFDCSFSIFMGNLYTVYGSFEWKSFASLKHIFLVMIMFCFIVPLEHLMHFMFVMGSFHEMCPAIWDALSKDV